MSISQLKSRRTIRCYDPNYVIPKEDLEKIVDAAFNSPSAMNVQETDLVVVTNKEKLQKLNDAVFASLDEKSQQMYLGMQKQTHVKQEVLYDCSAVFLLVKNERASPAIQQLDSGILAMSVLMAAHDLGLGTVPLGTLIRPQTQEVLGLPPKSVLLGIGVGKPLSFEPHPKENLRKVTYIE